VPGDDQVWSLVLGITLPRAVRVAAQAAVLTAVVGGTVAYAHSGTHVTLVVDGTPTTVQADSGDVRGLLADQGITVGTRDLVAPDPGSRLADGQQVVVRFARPLTLTVDGAPRTYWTTELTVDAALRSLGVRADGAKLSASRSAPLGRAGLDVKLSHLKPVTVVADGRTRQVTSTAFTVGDLLGEQGVNVRSTDQLSVLPTSPVVDGLVVALTRIDRTRETVTEKVPAPVRRQDDPTLVAGKQKVLQAGRDGSRTATYDVVRADGRPTSRTLVTATVISQPTPRVVAVGTKPAPAVATSSGGGSVAGADGLNWAALAKCESGGNPKAVNPAGYYGLYQFSPATWRAVGGSGLPTSASPAEQLYRAKLLYSKAGSGQWGCGSHLYD
jgi:uncharacterized protein YabE (DUF348 family)